MVLSHVMRGHPRGLFQSDTALYKYTVDIDIDILSVYLCVMQALTKLRAEHNSGPASAADLPEHRLIEEHWIRCVLSSLSFCCVLNQTSVLGHCCNLTTQMRSNICAV